MDEFELVDARMRDVCVTWHLRQAADVRAMSMDPRPIPFGEHRNWLARALRRPGVQLLMVRRSGQVIGTVRIEPSGAGPARISIALAASQRGRGLGRRVIAEACRRYRERHPDAVVEAWIRSDNWASRACFAAVGFVDNGNWIEQGGQRWLCCVQTPVDATALGSARQRATGGSR